MQWNLLLEEAKSLPRGRWTLVAGALWLTVLTLLAALALGSEGPALYSFLVVAYIVPNLALIPLTAGYVASDRSTRFVQSVFTSPVRSGEYVVAKLVPPAILGLAYLAATLPFLAVFAIHVGVPPLVWRFLLVAVALAACHVAVGGLFGVLLPGRTPAAAVGAASAFAVFSGVAALALPVALAFEGTARQVAVAVFHLSPVVLALDASDLYGFVQVTGGLGAAAALALLGTGALAATTWIFVRHQSPEGWEPRRGGALQVTAALALLVAAALLPPVLAGSSYAPAPPNVWSGSSTERGVAVLFVAPGASIRSLEGPASPYDNGKATTVDALVVFQRNATFPMHGATLRSLSPSADVVAGPMLVTGWQAAEKDVAPRIVRVPATITVHSPATLGRMPVEVDLEFSWTDGNGTVHREASRSLLFVHEPGAPLQLALSGLPAVMLCVGGYAVRKGRMR